MKVVDNFKSSDEPPPPITPPPSVNGITIGTTAVIVDPDSVERNTMGRGAFGRTLTHELAHALGLGHKVLASDGEYEHQEDGEYVSPNIMGREGNRFESPELTPDQIEIVRARAAELLRR